MLLDEHELGVEIGALSFSSDRPNVRSSVSRHDFGEGPRVYRGLMRLNAHEHSGRTEPVYQLPEGIGPLVVDGSSDGQLVDWIASDLLRERIDERNVEVVPHRTWIVHRRVNPG